MLNGYRLSKHGVVQQIAPFEGYEIPNYVAQYNSYGDKPDQLSWMRLGFLQGIMGHRNSGSAILDVGYGNGAFMKAAKSTFRRVDGFDVVDTPVPDGCFKVDSMFDRTYDVVTMFDAYEHFEDLSVIKELKTKYLIISVPHCRFCRDDAWFENWKHRRPNEHLHHFAEGPLIDTLREYGFNHLQSSHFEDAIRVCPDNEQNILTVAASKIG